MNVDKDLEKRHFIVSDYQQLTCIKLNHTYLKLILFVFSLKFLVCTEVTKITCSFKTSKI